jgi:hypothetical protein
VGIWKDTKTIYNKEMRGRKMEGRHKHYKQGNEKQKDGRTQVLSIQKPQFCNQSPVTESRIYPIYLR